MHPPALVIKNVSKRYNGSEELSINNLNFSIPSGEIFGILGPNGAGKTTLISIICGIINATSGSFDYHINDQLLSIKNAKKYIGYVPQNFAFYEELNPMQNLRYFGAMYNLSKNEIELRSNILLELLGLIHVINKKVARFSEGMKRRINLAIGLLHKPPILFLDEPVVGVDVQSKRAILNFLREENKRGTTIIYTSHNMKDAEDLCASFALLDFGEVIATGPVQKLLQLEKADSLEDYFINKIGNSYRD